MDIPWIRGRVAQQAHVGLPEGTVEEEFARNGFFGRYAHLYRTHAKPGATKDEIIAASIAAQAHDFILEFDQTYGTVVGERGVTLGGQRQRMALARAFLHRPAHSRAG